MAQVITFAMIPIITRIYTPEEFGLYSLFFSITTAIALISSFNYEQAIVLPRSDKDAQAIVFLSLVILLFIVILTIVFSIVMYDFLVNYFHNNTYFIWMLPISVLVLGLMQIFESYSNRKNFYKQMASAKIVSASSTAIMQISAKGIFSLDGLVFSKVFSDLLGILLLLRHHIKKQTLHLKSMSKRRVLVNAKRYDHFPKFQTGTSFINYLSQYLPIYLFPLFYTSEVAGFYALSFRMLMIPTTIMGSSVRSVYYQKASTMFSNNENIYPLYKKTTLGLIKLYLVPLFIIALFGKEIFSLLFSDKWLISGNISQIMIFLSFFAFINIPSVMTFNILKLQKLQLQLQILQFILRALAIYLGYYLYQSYFISILFYVLVAVSNNIFLIYYINKRLYQNS